MIAPLFAGFVAGSFFVIAVVTIRSFLTGWDPPGGPGGVIG